MTNYLKARLSPKLFLTKSIKSEHLMNQTISCLLTSQLLSEKKDSKINKGGHSAKEQKKSANKGKLIVNSEKKLTEWVILMGLTLSKYMTMKRMPRKIS
jgi:hypothetical protein